MKKILPVLMLMVACATDVRPHNPIKDVAPVTTHFWWRDPVVAKSKPATKPAHWSDPWSDFSVVHSGVVAPVTSKTLRMRKAQDELERKLNELFRNRRSEELPFDDTL